MNISDELSVFTTEEVITLSSLGFRKNGGTWSLETHNTTFYMYRDGDEYVSRHRIGMTTFTVSSEVFSLVLLQTLKAAMR